jgi:hypothetical protein
VLATGCQATPDRGNEAALVNWTDDPLDVEVSHLSVAVDCDRASDTLEALLVAAAYEPYDDGRVQPGGWRSLLRLDPSRCPLARIAVAGEGSWLATWRAGALGQPVDALPGGEPYGAPLFTLVRSAAGDLALEVDAEDGRVVPFDAGVSCTPEAVTPSSWDVGSRADELRSIDSVNVDAQGCVWLERGATWLSTRLCVPRELVPFAAGDAISVTADARGVRVRSADGRRELAVERRLVGPNGGPEARVDVSQDRGALFLEVLATQPACRSTSRPCGALTRPAEWSLRLPDGSVSPSNDVVDATGRLEVSVQRVEEVVATAPGCDAGLDVLATAVEWIAVRTPR